MLQKRYAVYMQVHVSGIICCTSDMLHVRTFSYCFPNLTGCGFCKRLKPDFAAAATALKGEAVSEHFILSTYFYELFFCVYCLLKLHVHT